MFLVILRNLEIGGKHRILVDTFKFELTHIISCGGLPYI